MRKTVETTPFSTTLSPEYRPLAGDRCRLVHTVPLAAATVSMVMTAFLEVRPFTCAIGVIGEIHSVSLAGPERVLSTVQYLRQSSPACGLGTSAFP